MNTDQNHTRSVRPTRLIRLIDPTRFSWFTLVFVLSLIGGGPSSLGEAPAVASKSSWPLPRGDAESTGWTATSLPKNLAVRWEFKADEAIETTPVIDANRVFVADVMGQIYALHQDTGKEIWRDNFKTGFLAAPAINGDLVVIGDIEGNIYALETKTGQQRWKHTTEGEVSGAVAFHNETVLATSQDGKLHCLSLKDGSPIWTYETKDQIRCSPTVAGGRTFLGGCDGQLHVVDLNTGQAIGNPLPLGGPTGSTPAIRDTKAFLPIMDGAVLAFDWQNSSELWRYEDAEKAQEYRNSAAVSADLVIVSSQYKQVDAISIATGKLKWSHLLRRRADASPLIAGDDVWIAATDGRLLRLSLETGEEKWNYEIRGAFLASPAIVGDELFIADDEGVVRCFSGKPAAEAVGIE
jgi:outer membrane protein assembly factor BamB